MRVMLVLEAIDKASRVINAIDGAIGKIDGTAARVTRRMHELANAAGGKLVDAQMKLVSALASAAAIAAPINDAVDKFATYQDLLEDVGIIADLVGDKLDAVGKKIRGTARAVNQSSNDLLKGMNVLMAGGLDVGDASGVIETNAKVTKAYKAGVEDIGNTTVTLIRNLKILPAEIGRTFDVLATASKAGNFELKAVAQYFPRIGAQYAAMGQTGVKAAADLVAALEVIKIQTGSDELAAVGLEDVLNKMTLGPAKKHFEELGIDIVQVMEDAKKAGTVIETIVATINKATGGDVSKIPDIFGDKQAIAGARALVMNYQEFLKIREDALKNVGAVETDFLRRMELVVEKVEALKVAFTELSITVGQIFAPMVTEKLTRLTDAVWAVEAWTKANPELARTAGQAALALGALLVAGAALRVVVWSLVVPVTWLGVMLAWVGRLAVMAFLLPFRAALLAARASVLLFRTAVLLLGSAAEIAVLGIAMLGRWLAWVGRTAVVAAVRGIAVLSQGLLWFARVAVATAIRGVLALGAALMATPIGWIIAIVAAIIAAGVALYVYWDRVGPWLAGVWAALVARGQALWGGFVGWLDGLWQRMVASATGAWSDLLDWLAGLPGRAMAALGRGWDALAAATTARLSALMAAIPGALDAGWAAVAAWFAGLKWPELPAFPDLGKMIDDAFGGALTKLSEYWGQIKGWFGDLKWPELPAMPDFGSMFGGSKQLQDALPASPAALEGVARSTAAIRIDLEAIAATKPAAALAGVNEIQRAAGDVTGLIKGIEIAAGMAVGATRKILGAANFHAEGVAMMETLAAGIRAGSGAAVAAVRGVTQQIRDHLPHSPAKVGPLSDLDRVRFSETLAGSIRAGMPAAIGAARAVAAGIAATIPGGAAAPQPVFARAPAIGRSGGAGSSGGGGPVSINLTFAPQIHGSSAPADDIRKLLPDIADELMDIIQRRMARSRRLEH
jgi:TP901 family phage tail tape measure protein